MKNRETLVIRLKSPLPIILIIYLLIFHYTTWLFIVVVVTKFSLDFYVFFCTPVVDACLNRLLN
jgi:hypothetical protein